MKSKTRKTKQYSQTCITKVIRTTMILNKVKKPSYSKYKKKFYI